MSERLVSNNTCFHRHAMIVTAGWAASIEKNRLHLPAWYPYDTSKSPAYQLTYIHQVVAIVIVATLNVSKDTLVTTLIAQTRCRLRLVGLALRNMCTDLIPENINLSLRFSLTALKLSGLWTPDDSEGLNRKLYYCYTFASFMFLLGTFLILQTVDLCLIWGNLPLMTGTAFILFTNISQATKIVNILVRRKHIDFLINDANESLKSETNLLGREIVKSCDRETCLHQRIFLFMTMITTAGWAASAEKNRLPLPAWYPYDTSKSPAYQLTYIHQVVAIVIVATLNVSKDTLVTTLIAQTRCRLRLVGLALRNICTDLIPKDHYNKSRVTCNKIFTQKQQLVIKNRLRIYVDQHQKALQAAALLQDCFSEPTFAQFTVSLIIICVTAFQVLSQTSNLVRLLSMGTYLLNMIIQVFFYCYQGHQLSVESEEVAGAAYEMQWDKCSVSTRRSILIVMQRSHRAVKLSAGGFTTLSLASFTAIIKLSYSMFTLLQQVNQKS